MNWRDSLRARLWLGGAAGVLLAALLSAWGLGAQYQRSALARFDARLVEDQLTLVGLLVRDTDGGIELANDLPDARYQRVFSGSYWKLGEGTGALRSPSLWDATLDLPSPAVGSAPVIVELPGPQGQKLRAIVRTVLPAGASAPVRVAVAADSAQLRSEIYRFRLLAGAAGAGIALLLLAAVAWQVRFGLRPLAGLGDALAEVRDGRIGRVPEAGLPQEVRPLATHLNELLENHERAVRRARHAAGDLAHAIKTPLAALTAAAGQQPGELPDLVRAQVNRISAALERHLNAGAPRNLRARCELSAVVDPLLTLMGQLHGARGLRFDADLPAGLALRCEAEDLEELLGNLLDNAGKWAASAVLLRAVARGDEAEITIEDDGPGLSGEDLAHARRRGVRLDEHVAGSGLGLAIVGDLAEALGGSLTLGRAPAGGLAATLRLPRAGT